MAISPTTRRGRWGLLISCWWLRTLGSLLAAWRSRGCRWGGRMSLRCRNRRQWGFCFLGRWWRRGGGDRETPRVHTHRVACSDRHHRDADCNPAADVGEGAGTVAKRAVLEQPARAFARGGAILRGERRVLP